MIKKIKPTVFYPPFLLLLVAVIASFLFNDVFKECMNMANAWLTETLGWLFFLSAFFMLGVCIVTFCSPFGRIVIGGSDARSILTRWRWFAIAFCTGIGVGIVLWCAPEPLCHFSDPPTGLHIEPNSPQASLRIFREAGIKLLDDEVCKILKAGGAEEYGEVFRFDPELIESLIAQTPAQFI